MGDRIRKWIAVLLAGSILAMIQLVPAGGAVFVRENIENKEILGEKETSLQQTLHARAWVLMDADSGRILAGKDADTAYPMASTTKILTCILALEQGNPDDWVEVSEKAASMPDVQLNMRAGERYRLSDLLYSLMLESHNDSAVAVAEHIGGSVEGFAEKMNRKAREIGCLFRDTERSGRCGCGWKRTQRFCGGYGADHALLRVPVAVPRNISGNYPYGITDDSG